MGSVDYCLRDWRVGRGGDPCIDLIRETENDHSRCYAIVHIRLLVTGAHRLILVATLVAPRRQRFLTLPLVVHLVACGLGEVVEGDLLRGHSSDFLVRVSSESSERKRGEWMNLFIKALGFASAGQRRPVGADGRPDGWADACSHRRCSSCAWRDLACTRVTQACMRLCA